MRRSGQVVQSIFNLAFQHANKLNKRNLVFQAYKQKQNMYPCTLRQRSNSVASLSELQGEMADMSLERAGDNIRLTKCEDQNFIANAYRYCARSLKGAWAQCPAEKFDVNYLTGGLTNYLYLCEIPESIPREQHEPKKVLIRISGDIVDQKQRFYEGVVFTLLSERGYGPKTYGIFNSGRIEEYIPYRNLFTRELADPEISRMVALKTAEYHTMNLPLNKDPNFLWENIEKYISICAEITFDDAEKQKMFEYMKKEIDVVEEYKWLKKVLMDVHSPVVFCHNDIQEGNILYINRENKAMDLRLIDYDYSSFNYRGFDIGNHFCEWMYEYSDKYEKGYHTYDDGYPTSEQQIRFAKHYIEVMREAKTKVGQKDFDFCKFNKNIDVCTVDRLLYEANRFALASHFFWFMWSIVQGRLSKIEFGYLEYAIARLDTYLKQKKELGYR